jgi:hypothetical protein
MATQGTELMKKIHSGEISAVKSGVAQQIRREISGVFEEIIEVGARIRPILMDGKRQGWIRGLSVNERKLLTAWYSDQNELIIEALTIATSFTREQVCSLNSYSFRSLLRLSNIMSTADVSLYPYLVPYTYTSSSEDLWRSGSRSFTTFYNKKIIMPDGAELTILCPSDHSRFWASLCDRRTQSLRELAASYDATLIAGSMVGKAASKIVTSLNKRAKYMEVNSDEPWRNITTKDQTKDLNLNDGWGHALDDSSEEGLLREGQGMVKYDKHEQFMEKFYTEYTNKENKKQTKEKEKEQGIFEEVSTVLTGKQVLELEKKANQRFKNLQKMAADESAENAERLEKKDLQFILD